MAEQHEEEPWEPDPNKPWMGQGGRNSTHKFTREGVRATLLSEAGMKYLRTYKNTSREDPEHVIDSRDEKLLTFLKLNYFEPACNYASPGGVKLDHLVYLGEVCSVTHFCSDSSCAVRCTGAHL